MKLELAILAGDESKKFLVDLTKQIDRLEKLSGKKAKASEETEEEEEVETEEETEVEDDDDDFSEKAPAKKGKTEDFDDEEVEESADEEEEEAPEEKPKRGRKPKKLTSDDVNAACKDNVHAQIERGTGSKEARSNVVALLKKKFKVSSVSDLEEDQYADVIKALKK